MTRNLGTTWRTEAMVGAVSNAEAGEALPLAGSRVLITRAPHQASVLAERLRGLGAETILIPTIEIVPPASFAALDEALGRMASFDMVVFTSANAVRAFEARVNELGVTARPRWIAVVGPATAQAVEAIGLRVDAMPLLYTAVGLAEMLWPAVRGRRVLLVVAEGAPRMLEKELDGGGAEIVAAAAYANRVPRESLAAIKRLFADGMAGFDAVTFTSASTAGHLVALLETAGVRLPESVARISIGPVTSRALHELGLPAHVEAAEATLDALVAAVVEELRG